MVNELPMDKNELRNLNVSKATRRGGTRIGKDDPLLQDIVTLINEFPKRVTLTGLAETLHLRGKYLDVKESNLRSRIRRRIDILHRQIKDGKPVLKRKSELRVDAFGETDGTIRYVWYLPEYEEDIIGEKMTIDEFMVLLSEAMDKQPNFIKQIIEDWKITVSDKIVRDPEGWKIEFWQHLRELNKDLMWSQLYAAEMGLEQDALMQKRVIRSLSPIIEDIWESIIEE